MHLLAYALQHSKFKMAYYVTFEIMCFAAAVVVVVVVVNV
jgi:hypothetical protein